MVFLVDISLQKFRIGVHGTHLIYIDDFSVFADAWQFDKRSVPSGVLRFRLFHPM